MSENICSTISTSFCDLNFKVTDLKKIETGFLNAFLLLIHRVCSVLVIFVYSVGVNTHPGHLAINYYFATLEFCNLKAAKLAPK